MTKIIRYKFDSHQVKVARRSRERVIGGATLGHANGAGVFFSLAPTPQGEWDTEAAHRTLECVTMYRSIHSLPPVCCGVSLVLFVCVVGVAIWYNLV